MNRKKMSLILSLLLVSPASFAVPQFSGATPAGGTIQSGGGASSSSGGGPSTSGGQAAPSSGTAVSGGCDDESQYITHKMLDWISRSTQATFESDFDPETKKLKVTMKGKSLKECSNFKVYVEHYEGSQYPVVKVKNELPASELEAGIDTANYSAAEISNMSYTEKYVACLHGKGIIGANGQISHVGRSGNEYKQNYQSAEYELKGVDLKKPLRLVYGSPEIPLENYGGYMDSAASEAEGASQCLKVETVRNGSIITEAQRIENVCKFGTVEQISKELSNIPSGNFSALVKLLNDARIERMKLQWKEINEELQEIEEKFRLDRNGSEELSDTSKKNLAKKYLELLETYKEEIQQPALDRVTQLLEDRESTATDSDEQEKIDVEIKKLNEVVGKFSKKGEDYEAMIDDMLEVGAIDQASKIHAFRLSSQHYSRVYAESDRDTRASRLTFDEASKKIKAELKDFDEDRGLKARERYAASQGSEGAIKAARNRARRSSRRLSDASRRFYRSQDKAYGKYCGDPRARREVIEAMSSGRRADPRMYGIRDPSRCSRHLKSSVKREDRFNRWRRDKYYSTRADEAHVEKLYRVYDESRERYDDDEDSDFDYAYEDYGEDDEYSFFTDSRSSRGNYDRYNNYSFGGNEYAYSMRDDRDYYNRSPSSYGGSASYGYDIGGGYGNEYSYGGGNNGYRYGGAPQYGNQDPFAQNYSPVGQPVGQNAQGFRPYETGPVYQSGF